MSQHTDWKYKHGQMAKRNHNKHAHFENMSKDKPKDDVRANFLRPAYGKIGERREENEDNI